ncbi:MAG: YihY/virulence factor BrkB family protein [Oscillospiraceae bacterium]|nr:YihY/virulence factor BrkB family protein [Oscillospiraceae bacterium]
MDHYLERHHFLSGAYQMAQRYFDHHVARDSAALTYYLLFALFPLLIFLSNLVGMMSLDINQFLAWLHPIMPQEALEIIEQYLIYVSRDSSRQLLWFSLIFSIYFPYRAASALMGSVRKAYGAQPPTHFWRYQFKLLLYTLCLIVIIVLSIALSVVGGRVLNFVSGYISLSDGFIELWSRLRFAVLGFFVFFAIALMYALAQESRTMNRIWPGAAASLVMWLALSFLFSFYVENIARYSVIYGTLGAVIVLLLWLYLAAMMLIMGAEFNSVLMTLRKKA